MYIYIEYYIQYSNISQYTTMSHYVNNIKYELVDLQVDDRMTT